MSSFDPLHNCPAACIHAVGLDASSTRTLLLSLSTIAGTKISNPSWVIFQSAGWVSFQSAPTGLGSAKAKDKKEELLSQILDRLNELFVTDQLTDKDMVNYAYTIRDKVSENQLVMQQLANNTAEQALLGNFANAVDDAIMDSGDAHQNQMMQLLSDPAKASKFARVIFDLLNLTT